MKRFHINLGLLFARPYESGYATLRRCLAVNPGVSLYQLARDLRDAIPELDSMLERIHYLQGVRESPPLEEFGLFKNTFRRQCPHCARTGYHSDIYIAPWLPRCPIHDCEFTWDCPVCGQPWPTLRQIAVRDCPGCSTIPLEQFATVLRESDYHVIGALYQFAAAQGNLVYALEGGRGRIITELVDTWWHEFSIDSRLFASCQAHRLHILSAAQLEALHVLRPPLHRRSAKLTHVPETQWKPGRRRRTPQSVDLAKTSPRRLRGDFTVMRTILAWIAQQTAGHHIHLSSYRHLRTAHFLDGPAPCPYCLGLSLWFFHTAAKRYGIAFRKYVDIYPFLEDTGFGGFFEVWEPYVRVNDTNIFFPDARFTAWFYRRGLELLFITVLRFVFQWWHSLQIYRSGRSAHPHFEIPPRSLLSDQYCGTALDHARLIFYYENERPLAHYTPPTVEHAKARCRRYHKYLAASTDPVTPFHCPVDSHSFTFATFRDVHREYGSFLRKAFGYS